MFKYKKCDVKESQCGQNSQNEQDPGTSDEDFLLASSCNDLNRLKQLVRLGRPINCTDENGVTPLHVATREESVDIFNYLLEVPDILKDVQDCRGDTPLHYAMHCTSSAFAMMLINSGVSVNTPNSNGKCPLHLAVLKFPDAAELLIQKGANVNKVDKNRHTPLHEAVLAGNSRSVSVLLQYKANTNIMNYGRMTPFILCLTTNPVVDDIQEMLFERERCFDWIIHENGVAYSTFLLALRNKCPLVPRMLERGVDVNMRIGSYNSVRLALWYGDVDVFRTILNKVSNSIITSDSAVSVILVLLEDNDKRFNNWLDFLNAIFSSAHLNRFLAHYKYQVEFIFKPFILTFYHKKKPEEVLMPFLQKLLNFSRNIYLQELNTIHNLFGNSKVLELFFHNHINLKMECMFPGPSIPLFMYYLQFMPRKCAPSVFHGVSADLREIARILRFITPMPKIKKDYYYPYILSKVSEPYKLTDFDKMLENAVPSLTELSRDAARLAMFNYWKVKRPDYFYRRLNNLNIKRILKDIICFKVPVNKPVNN